MSLKETVRVATVPRACEILGEQWVLKCSAVFTLSFETVGAEEMGPPELGLLSWPSKSGLFTFSGQGLSQVESPPLIFHIAEKKISRNFIKFDNFRLQGVTAKDSKGNAELIPQARKILWDQILSGEEKDVLWIRPSSRSDNSPSSQVADTPTKRKSAMRNGSDTIEGLRSDDVNEVVVTGLAVDSLRSERGGNTAAMTPPAEMFPEDKRSGWHDKLRDMEQAVERQSLVGSSGAASGALEREFKEKPVAEEGEKPSEKDLRNEFHHRIAALDEYPHLQLLLGLIVDFEVEIDKETADRLSSKNGAEIRTQLVGTGFDVDSRSTVAKLEGEKFFALCRPDGVSFIDVATRFIKPEALDTVQWDLQSGLRSVLRSNGYLDDSHRLHAASPPSGYGVTVFWKKDIGLDLGGEIQKTRNKEGGEEKKELYADDLTIGFLPGIKRKNDWHTITARKLSLRLDDGIVIEWEDEKPLTPSNVEAPQPLTGWVIDCVSPADGQPVEDFILSTTIGLVVVRDPKRVVEGKVYEGKGGLSKLFGMSPKDVRIPFLGHYGEFHVNRGEDGNYILVGSELRLGQGLAGPVVVGESLEEKKFYSLKIRRRMVVHGESNETLDSFAYLRGIELNLPKVADGENWFFQGRGDAALVAKDVHIGHGEDATTGLFDPNLTTLFPTSKGVLMRYIGEDAGLLRFELADSALNDSAKELAREVRLKPTQGTTKIATLFDPESTDFSKLAFGSVYRVQVGFFFDPKVPKRSELRIATIVEEARPESAHFLRMFREDDKFFAEFRFNSASASATVIYELPKDPETLVELLGTSSGSANGGGESGGDLEGADTDASSQSRSISLRSGTWRELGHLIGERDECLLESIRVAPIRLKESNREVRSQLRRVQVVWHDTHRSLLGMVHAGTEKAPTRDERRFVLSLFGGKEANFEIDQRTVIVALPDSGLPVSSNQWRLWNHPPHGVPLRVTLERPGSPLATRVEVVNRFEIGFDTIQYDDGSANKTLTLRLPSSAEVMFNLGGEEFPYDALKKAGAKGPAGFRAFLDTELEFSGRTGFSLVLEIEGKASSDGTKWGSSIGEIGLVGAPEKEGDVLKISLQAGSSGGRTDVIIPRPSDTEPAQAWIQISESPDRKWVRKDSEETKPQNIGDSAANDFEMNEAMALVLRTSKHLPEIEAGRIVPVFVEAIDTSRRHMHYEILRLAHETGLPLETTAEFGLFIDKADDPSKDWDLIKVEATVVGQNGNDDLSPSRIGPDNTGHFRAALESKVRNPGKLDADQHLKFDWVFSEAKSLTTLMGITLKEKPSVISAPKFRPSDQVLVDDVLMQWNGWSLAVPPPHWVRGLLSAEELPKIREVFAELFRSRQTENFAKYVIEGWDVELHGRLGSSPSTSGDFFAELGKSLSEGEIAVLMLETLNGFIASLARMPDSDGVAGNGLAKRWPDEILLGFPSDLRIRESTKNLIEERKSNHRDWPLLIRRLLEDRLPELVVRPLLDVETTLPRIGNGNAGSLLPRLRVSTEYRFTFRCVDLAGNHVDVAGLSNFPEEASLKFLPFSRAFAPYNTRDCGAISLLRFQPIGAPVVWDPAKFVQRAVKEASLDSLFPLTLTMKTVRFALQAPSSEPEKNPENTVSKPAGLVQDSLELSVCPPPIHWQLAEWLGTFDEALDTYQRIAKSMDWEKVPGFSVEGSTTGFWHDTVKDPDVAGFLVVFGGRAVEMKEDGKTGKAPSKMGFVSFVRVDDQGALKDHSLLELVKGAGDPVPSNPMPGTLPDWKEFGDLREKGNGLVGAVPPDAEWEIRIYALPKPGVLDRMPLLVLATSEKSIAENSGANDFLGHAADVLEKFSAQGSSDTILSKETYARLLLHPWNSSPRVIRIRHITNQPFQAPELVSLEMAPRSLGQTDGKFQYRCKVHRPSTGSVVLQAALEEEYADDPRSPLPKVPDEELMRILEDESLREEARQRLLDWEHEMERLRRSDSDPEVGKATGKELKTGGGKTEIGESDPANAQERVQYLGRSNDLTAYLGRPPLDVASIVPTSNVHVEAHGPDLHACQFDHEFFDTRHRTVYYRGVAQTRYGHLPEAFGEDGVETNPPTLHQLAPTDSWARVEVPATVRPSNLVVKDVTVLFEWSGGHGTHERSWHESWNGAWHFNRTRRSGHRIWLERPWYSSGSGEKLAVLLWMDANVEWDRAGEYQELVSRWGVDPVFEKNLPKGGERGTGLGVLTREDFLLPWAAPLGLRSLPIRNEIELGSSAAGQEEGGASNKPEIKDSVLDTLPVGLAVYQPRFDPERRLWYADVFVEPKSYTPFVAYTVARYQPCSLPECALSAPERIHPVQILPPRTLTVTAAASGLIELDVRLSGIFPPQNRRRIVVRIERNEFVEESASETENDDAILETELGWMPVALLDGTGSLVEEVIVEDPVVASGSPNNRNGEVQFKVTLPEVPFHHSRLADRKGMSTSEDRDDSHPCRFLRLSVAEDELYPAAHAMPEDQRFLPRRVYLDQVFLPRGLLKVSRREPDLRGPTHEGGPRAAERSDRPEEDHPLPPPPFSPKY